MLIFFIVFISIIELVVGCALLALLFQPLRKFSWPSLHKRQLFVVFGVLLISPTVAPAGAISVIPLPIGVLLAFIRSSSDVIFLFRTWWFLLPSMLVTGFVFRHVANRMFLIVNGVRDE